MLVHLDIRNFALIEKLTVEPGSGLLILTGETGAGKSILIDAIGSLSGKRLSKDLIRHGAKAAEVEALFQVPLALIPQAERNLFSETDLQGDQVSVVLSREINQSGRSVCRINGRMATMGSLQDLARVLFDIHGQHDQQAIFQENSHLSFLDRYGGQAVAAAKVRYKDALDRLSACLAELKTLGSDPGERARRLDLLAFQIHEIEGAGLVADEDKHLLEQQKLLTHAEKIKAALTEAYERLTGDEPGDVLYELGDLQALLSDVSAHAEPIQQVSQTLLDVQDQLQTAVGQLRYFHDRLEADPEELDRINERLDVLYRLKKKYGGSLQAVAAFLDQAKREHAAITDGEARYEALQVEKEKRRQQLLQAADALTASRREAAGYMEAAISRELADLGLKDGRFAVSFKPFQPAGDRFSPEGSDRVAFAWSVNPGEPLKPLAQIASGGEASRIMLAIKTSLTDVDPIPVLIFDEIDTGISGATAAKVGEKLMQLADRRQVFCITHMAQIASMADEHWLIEKEVRSGRTRTGLTRLSEDGRSRELARLLSGGVGDQTARSLAGQLRDQAEAVRKRIR